MTKALLCRRALYQERDLNPHVRYRTQDFKSCVSTNSTIPAEKKKPLFLFRIPMTLYFRAKDETRTRDPNLGKVVLYQLSYFRLLSQWDCKDRNSFFNCKKFLKNFSKKCIFKSQYTPK